MTKIVPFRHANNGESERIAGDIFDHYREKARDDKERKIITRQVFSAMISQQPLTRWQKFCLLISGA